MKKTLLVLLTLCSLLIGTNAIGEEPKPVTPEPQSPAPAEKAYWLTIKSSIRHNSKCKYYHLPKEQPQFVGDAGHVLIVRVVGEANIIAAQFLGPAEQLAGFSSRGGAAAAQGIFLVEANPAQENGFAVEQNVGAAGFNRAKAEFL